MYVSIMTSFGAGHYVMFCFYAFISFSEVLKGLFIMYMCIKGYCTYTDTFVFDDTVF